MKSTRVLIFLILIWVLNPVLFAGVGINKINEMDVDKDSLTDGDILSWSASAQSFQRRAIYDAVFNTTKIYVVSSERSSSYPATYFDDDAVMQKTTTANTARITSGDYKHPLQGKNLGDTGNAFCIDRSGNYWIATNTGLYKSTDQGVTKSLKDTVARQGTLTCRMIFQASNGYLYWSQWGSGTVRRSTDGGETWAASLTYATAGTDCGIDGFDEDSVNGYLYAAVYTAGEVTQDEIYRSVDHGANWIKKYDGSDRHIHKLKVDPYTRRIYATTGDKPTSCSLVMSSDYGENWTDIYSTTQLWGIGFLPGMRLFGDDETGGYIYKTTDDIHFTYAYTPSSSLYGNAASQWGDRVVFSMLSANSGHRPFIMYSDDGATWNVMRWWTTTNEWNGAEFLSNIDDDGNFVIHSAGESTAYRLNINDGFQSAGALMEESASTNYCTNSVFAGDTNSDGIANDWEVSDGALVPSYSLVNVKSIFNVSTVVNAQRIQQSGQTSTTAQIIVYDGTRQTGFSEGDSVTVSAYLKGELKGCLARFIIYAYTDADAYIDLLEGVELVGIVPTSFNKFSSTFTLPATTAKIRAGYLVYNIDTGETADLQVTCFQPEKLTASTSFIPTTSGAVSRASETSFTPTVVSISGGNS